MRLLPIGESGAHIIELKVHGDDRGWFARTWCAEELADAGIRFTPRQANTSLTRRRGAIRGMHFQRAPRADAKIVRCSRGAIHDVVVDMREDSASRGAAYAVELTAEGGKSLHVPAGFAHGFQTLADDTLVEYLMGEFYVPDLYDGFRHDDPALKLEWPEPVTEVSERDRSWPNLAERMPWLAASGVR